MEEEDWERSGDDSGGQKPHHDLRAQGRRHLRRRVQNSRRRDARELDPEDRATVIRHFQECMPYGAVRA
jgi:hypothetical protein